MLDTAFALTSRSGIDSLTMSGLAEAAGVSKPVVYEHFSKSEDVALALLDSCFERMISRVHERARGAPSLQEYMAIVVDCHCDAVESGELTVRTITNGMTRSHAVGDRLNSRYQFIRERAAATISEMLEQQGAEPQAARITGQVMFDILNVSLPSLGCADNMASVRETLKTLLSAMIDRIANAAPTQPRTPQTILDDAVRLRQWPGGEEPA